MQIPKDIQSRQYIESAEYQKQICPKCKIRNVVVVDGQVKCLSCGFIQSLHFISHENENTNMDDDETGQVDRGSFQPNFNIDFDPIIIGDRPISLPQNQEKDQSSAKQWKSIIDQGSKTIIDLCKQMSYPQCIIDGALKDFKKSMEDKQLLGSKQQNKQMQLQVCLQLYKTIKKICQPSESQAMSILKKISKYGRVNLEDLQNKLKNQEKKKKEKPLIKAIAKIVNLKFDEDDKKNLELIDKKIDDLQIVGGEKAETIAGVEVYMACQRSKNPELKSLSMKQVCDRCQFTENTIRRFFDNNIKNKKFDLDKQF